MEWLVHLDMTARLMKSKKMANLSLIPAINNSGEKDFIVANGTSCRHQISDLSEKKGKHVSELLFKIFETVN